MTLNTSIPLTSNYSFSFWAKKTSGTVLSSVFTNGISKYVLWVSGATYYIRISDNGASYSFPSTSIDNNWHFYSIVITSSTNVDLYVDGSYINSWTIAPIVSGFNITNIGGYNGTFIYPIVFDEIAVWNTALSPTDISNLYNSGNGDFATNYSPANLQAYWRMNGVSGDGTAVDEEGTYNGTLNNFDTATCWVAH